jgi:ubiquinone/menaquinone biosynthesis C-methylase UbiE
MIKVFLKKNYILKNGIYLKKFNLEKQKIEFKMRTDVAKKNFKDYFKEISKNHSIEVMDHEITKFTKQLKKNAIILDLGCGWCWHWRNIDKIRPDIVIVAIDFVRENFDHAKKILSKKSLKQFYFINDDIHNINFKNNIFDSIWTVQVFQHIPNVSKVLKEAYRVLKVGGTLFNYNLNNSVFVALKNLLLSNKSIKKYYYLNRNLNLNLKLLTKIFKKKVFIEYNEILFHPELNLFLGKKNYFLSKIDSRLSGPGLVRSYIARQVLMKITK